MARHLLSSHLEHPHLDRVFTGRSHSPSPAFSAGWGVLAWEALVSFASPLVPPSSVPEEVKTL